jgi:hypothetical protein
MEYWRNGGLAGADAKERRVVRLLRDAYLHL